MVRPKVFSVVPRRAVRCICRRESAVRSIGFVSHSPLVLKIVPSDPASKIDGWESVCDSFEDLRAGHDDFDRFFSETFDQLGSLWADFLQRQGERQAEQSRAATELAAHATQLEQQIATLEAQRGQLGDETAQLREQLAAAAVREDERVSRIVEETNQEQAALQGQVDAALAQVEQFSEASTGNDQRVKQVMEASNQERAALRSQLEAAQAQIEHLSSSMAGDDERVRKVLEEANQERTALRKQLEASQGQVEQLAAVTSELVGAQTQLAKAQTKLAGAQTELTTSHSELAAAHSDLAAARAELADAREEIVRQQSQIESAGMGSAEAESQLRETLRRTEEDRANLRDQLETARKEPSGEGPSAEDQRALQAELAQAREESGRQAERIESLRAEVASAQSVPTSGREDDALREQLQQERTAFAHERNGLESELETIRNRAADLTELIETQKREMATERAGWTDEFKRLRHMLENRLQSQPAPSNRISHADDPQPQAPETAPTQPGAGDPVLDSVMAQFEMLQKDLIRRRAKKSGAERQRAS